MKAHARQYAESLSAAYASDKHNPQELVKGLMGLLRKKRNSKLAKNILAHLLEKEAEEKGTAAVVVETAHEITEASKKMLTKRAEALFPDKKIIATFQVVPELQSGFRIRGKGKQIDQSFTTHLKALRNQLTHL